MLHILVESTTAEILLARFLQTEQQDGSIEIRAVAERSSLYGAAQAVLIMRREPVAVVLDSESTYPRVAARQRQGAEEVIGDAAWRAPLRILVAVPALEALLFRRPDAVARAYGPAPPQPVGAGPDRPPGRLSEAGSERLDRAGLAQH